MKSQCLNLALVNRTSRTSNSQIKFIIEKEYQIIDFYAIKYIFLIFLRID